MVADFCAGAGGKTLLLGALMRSQGRLYAFDVAERRLARLKPRLARSGLSNVHPVRIESERDTRIRRLAGKLDRVLVDAPCSGLGTLRRNPDLKWRQTPASVAELCAKQAAILAAAGSLVKAGWTPRLRDLQSARSRERGVVQAFLARTRTLSVLGAGVLARQEIAIDVGERLRLVSPSSRDRCLLCCSNGAAMNEKSMFALLFELWRDFQDPAFLWQVLALGASLLLAWGLSRYGRRQEFARASTAHGALRAFGTGSLKRVAFPLLALLSV
jgi:precorrin-6B methylase 2